VRGAPSIEIDQGYLPGERINERIRRSLSADGVRYHRTIKSGAGIDRGEIEEETTELFFTTVWPLTRGCRVRKRRYLVEDGGVTWEIDEFLDRDGLWLAEIELERVDHDVPVPDWLRPAIVREVTDEPRFTNHALAR
jgi:CYTH domain-containing protein